MSGSNGGLWRALAAGLVAALAGLAKGQGGSKPQQGQGGKAGGSSSTAVLRGEKKTSSSTKSHDGRAQQQEQPSPGSYGADATRDLTRAEIRALRPSYEPKLDGEPDPGEVVWTWVPYVENDGRGKDRPVLIIARMSGGVWAGCYLSTKQHQGFVSVGTGPWDSQGRESFLSPERVLRVTERGMRRESTGLGRENFERAVAAVRRHHGG